MITSKKDSRPEIKTTEFGYFLVRTDLIDPLEGQPRTYFDLTEAEEMKKSLNAVGQLKPVVLRKNKQRFTLTDGERRWRGCRDPEVNIEYMKAVFDDGAENQSIFLRSLVYNLRGAAHTHKDMYNALMGLILDGNKATDIAAALGKTDGWIYMYTKLAKLDPALLDLIDSKSPEDKLPMQAAAKLAQLPLSEQRKVYEKTLNQTLTQRRMIIECEVDGHPQRQAVKRNRNSDRVKAFGGSAIDRLNIENDRLKLLIEQDVPSGFHKKFGDEESRRAIAALEGLSHTALKFSALLKTKIARSNPM